MYAFALFNVYKIFSFFDVFDVLNTFEFPMHGDQVFLFIFRLTGVWMIKDINVNNRVGLKSS